MKKNWPYIVIAIVLVIGLVYVVRTPQKSASVSGNPQELSTSEAPWPPELTNLKARLGNVDLPALMQEGDALHIHQHLDIVVHGQTVGVPANIGIHVAAPKFIAPIHTHDTAGIVHVESPTVQKFTLGEFFTIWGVRLTDACMGGYCTDATNTLAVYVNGERYQGDPRTLELTNHQEIAIIYGTPSEMPTSTPSTYAFPAGY